MLCSLQLKTATPEPPQAEQQGLKGSCPRARRRSRGAMLLLFETAAGHALYELKHEEKLKKLDADKLASKLSEDEESPRIKNLRSIQRYDGGRGRGVGLCGVEAQ